MNKYLHAGICTVMSVLKFSVLRAERKSDFSCKLPALVSPGTEITIDRGGKLTIGKMFRIRSGAKLRVRKSARVKIGANFSMSNNCMIVSWEYIEIGDNVQFGPGVLVYDQDHDYCAEGGLAAEKYKTAPVKIGNNVWIGANAIILRGSVIGDNCVVAAGTIIKGSYEPNQLIYPEKKIKVKAIKY